MAKQLQVNLQFNANISQAKQQMQALQQQLSSLMTSSATGQLGIVPQLQEAQTHAMNLKIALNNAMNVNTGKLNLNKFQSELNRSGMTLQQLSASMKALGPEGVRTFSSVANAVAQADTKLFSLQGGMKKLAGTFMNTIRWQVAASAIQGVTSAISNTVDYAKQLDTSLNNIRIVTGKSADQMARFAKEANNMAKSLSTTTTKYTDASLIYYQQGLNDNEVRERTETTVKLANVVGENAETVSEWMTAIWNNFDDGSESLEYYADVLAKLGAATASSADEIAGGLEKFAAVADTIGLSYEYAASMLATITAETRQSEDVVGTALKTILSRMEQLEQGDTLEDGTTLGKYSLALQKVGVDIKNASGELKDMDIILQQTGQRWDTLGRDQQIALAQSVAGIRQYTQFMALMDNWDVMERNLELTEQANGALETQQGIYAESMEAAEQRMTASAEKVKDTLLSGDDLIPLYNFASGALDVVNELLEAFGGLPTILLAVAAALTKVYQPQIASFFSQTGIALKGVLSSAKNLPATLMGKETTTPAQSFKSSFIDEAASAAASTLPEGSAQSAFLKQNAELQKTLLDQEGKMLPSVKQQAEWQMEILKSKQQIIIANEQIIDQMASQIGEKEGELQNLGATPSTTTKIIQKGEGLGRAEAAKDNLVNALEQTKGSKMDSAGRQQASSIMQGSLDNLRASAVQLDADMNKLDFKTIEDQLKQFADNGEIEIDELIRKIEKLHTEINQQGQNGLNTLTDQAIMEAGGKPVDTSELDKGMQSANVGTKGIGEALDKVDEKTLNKENKDKLKGYKDRAKALRDEKKAITDSLKTAKKGSAEEKKLLAQKQKNTKATKTLRQEVKDFSTVLKKQGENTEEITQKTKDLGEASIKSGKAMGTNGEAIKNVNGEADKLKGALENGGAGLMHWSDSLALGVQGLSSYLMGLSMLTSAFEQLGKAMVTGGDGFSDWVSNLSSLFMSIMMIIPGIQSMQKSIVNTTASIYASVIAKKAERAEQKKKIVSNAQEVVSEKTVQKEKQKTSLFSILKAWAGVAEDAGKGMPGWVEALASAAMIAPIAVMVGGAVVSGLSGAKQAKQEEQQAEVDKGVEQLEGISENQELAKSVNDLTDEYQRLQAAGEGTKDVFEDLKEQMPDLIKSYKELESSLGEDFDTSGLERAYEYFLATGDASKMIAEQARIDAEIANTQGDIARATGRTKADLMMAAATDGGNDGRMTNGVYEVTIGGAGSDEDEASRVLEEVLGDKWENSQITFDASTSGGVIEGYEAMLKAQQRLKEEGLEESDTYREITRELKEMSEHYEQLKEIQSEVYEAAQQAFPDEEKDLFKNYDITSLETYKTKRNELIDILKDEYDLTTEQAQALLKESEAYGRFEDAVQVFVDDSTIVQQIKAKGSMAVEEVQKWYASLPEQDRTLFIGLDFSTIGSLEEAKIKMDELREKALIAEARNDAETLGVDSDTFDTYAYLLGKTNKELDINTSETAQAALANIRLNKGLEELQKNWKNNLTALSKNERGSLEYAEALGEVKEQLEKMFDVELSPAFIENNLGLINEIANGNVEALDDLQDKMAEDYIANMVINDFSINENEITKSAQEARDYLTNMMKNIDNDIEMGKNVNIDGYLDTLQEMVDAGQITEEQLQMMFKAKGFEFKVTGWKQVPGPEKTITRKYKNWLGREQTDVITEQETMQVPIINGDDEGIVSGTASKATINKLTDDSSFDFSRKSEDQGGGLENKNELKKLDEEVDRYHEIDKTITSLERHLDRLSKAKDRAYGKDKIALIDAEIAATERSIEAQKKKIKEAQDYLVSDGSIMAAYGAKFDQYGNISNYEEMYQKQIDAYNNVMKKGSDFDKENAKEAFDEFKEHLEDYEETVETVNEEQDKLTDQMNTLQDLSLEKIEYKLEVKLEITDKEREIIDFLMEQAESTYDTAAAIKGHQDSYSVAKKDFDSYKDSITSLLQSKNLTDQQIAKFFTEGDISALEGVEFTADEMADLQEWSTGLFESYGEAKAAWEGMHEALMSGWDKYKENIDNAVEKMQFASDLITNFEDIVDLVGRDVLGINDDFLDMMKASQKEIRETQIASEKEALDASIKAYNQMKERRDELLTRKNNGEILTPFEEQQLAKYEEETQALWDGIETRTNNVNNLLMEGFEAAAEEFGEQLQKIADDFIETMSGFSSAEELQEAFDRQSEISERYLEDYEKMYELTKLTKQVSKEINKTDSPAAKKRLLDIQEKITDYQTMGVEMSKYELSNLQKQYELELAYITLIEAQNAKTQVRLQRDSEGNYGYIYTANQEQIDTAQQKYDDALYNLIDNTQSYIQQCDEMLVQAQIRFAEQIADMQNMTFESEEERVAYQNKIQQEFLEDTQYWTGQLDIALGDNQTLYDNFTRYITGVNDSYMGTVQGQYSNFATWFGTTYKTDVTNQVSDFINGFNETFIGSHGLGLTGSCESAQDLFNNLVIYLGNAEVSDSVFGKIDSAFVMFKDKVDEYFNAAGGSIGTFASDVDAAINGGTLSGENGATTDGVLSFVKNLGSYTHSTTTQMNTDFSTNASVISKWEAANSREMNQMYNSAYYANVGVYNLLTDYNDLSGKSPISKNIDIIINGDDKLTELLKKYNEMVGKNNIEKTITVTTYHKDVYGDGDGNASGYGNDDGTTTNQSYKSSDTILAEGIDKDGYAIVLVSNGKIYSRRAVGGSVGDKATFINQIAYEGGTDIKVTGKEITKGTYKAYKFSNGIEYKVDKNNNKTAQGKIEGIQQGKNSNEWFIKNGAYWFKANTLSYFDTGGYTGSWGPEGRLAMLHQKEIILNAHDTENFLTAIKIVRAIADKLDANAAIAAQGLGAYINAAITPATSGDTLQQEVHITAEFPNATNHNEIEQAFENIVNLASQYANRK